MVGGVAGFADSQGSGGVGLLHKYIGERKLGKRKACLIFRGSHKVWKARRIDCWTNIWKGGEEMAGPLTTAESKAEEIFWDGFGGFTGSTLKLELFFVVIDIMRLIKVKLPIWWYKLNIKTKGTINLGFFSSGLCVHAFGMCGTQVCMCAFLAGNASFCFFVQLLSFLMALA